MVSAGAARARAVAEPLFQGRVGVVNQLERHLREPDPSRGIGHVVAGRVGGASRAAIALSVGLARDLHPEKRRVELHARIDGWREAKPASGRVAPVLVVGIADRRDPRTLAVSAGIDDEVREAAVAGVAGVGLALDVAGVPGVAETPGGKVAGRRRVILTGAPVEVTTAPVGAVEAEPDALRDPRTVLLQVVRRLVVGHVQEEAVRPSDAG